MALLFHAREAEAHKRKRQVSGRGEQRVRLLGYPDPRARSLWEEKDHAVPVLRRPPTTQIYRAINADGNLVETMPSKTRDMEAAKRFFAYALQTVGQAPEKVTTDGHDSYPRAVRETLGPNVCHGASRSMNNRIEQDHRGIKQRSYPLRGFGSFDSAARFSTAHDELRDHFRPRTRFNEAVSLADQRRLFQERWGAVCALLQAA